MADVDEPTSGDAATVQEPDQGTTSAEPDGLGDAGKKAIAEERKRAREAQKLLTEAQVKLREFEDRDKSEQQKLTERAEAAEKLAADHGARLVRLEIATEKGLTPSQAKRLVGDTREALEADADELLADLGKSRPAGIDQGPRGGPPVGSPADEFARIIQSRLGG